MAANGDIVRGIFTGEEEPERRQAEDMFGGVWTIILPNVTHLSIHESITIIPSHKFHCHPNIVELICHNGVRTIEYDAFWSCPRLKRLIMPGIEEVERCVFSLCAAIEHVECQKLEIIGEDAFSYCESLGSIDLPSAKIVEEGAFDGCDALTDVKFGKNLESIGEKAFSNAAVKRITIPLKGDLFTHDDVFVGCDDLDQVFLIEEAIIHEIVNAFFLDEWKSDMKEELDSINQTLPYADAGVNDAGDYEGYHAGEKTRVIHDWIERVLQKIIHYKVEHYRLLSLAAAALAYASPNEIVINNVLSFFQLPDHAFEGEGDSSATTPALDRQMWENVVEMEQRRIEMENIARLEKKLLEKDMEIAALKAQNDEKGDEIHQLKMRLAHFEQSGVFATNDAGGLPQKRPR